MLTEKPRGWVVLVASMLMVGACAEAEDESDRTRSADPEVPAAAPTLQDVLAVGVPNAAMPLGDIVTAG